MKKAIVKTLAIIAAAALLSPAYAALATGDEIAAAPSTQEVWVDGSPASIRSYMIAGSNYARIRDIARAVDCYVGYEASTSTVLIDTTKPYGGEDEAATPPLQDATAALSRQNFKLNGSTVWLMSFLISGSNYVSLRSFASCVDIGLDYDEATRRVLIDTARTYHPDGTLLGEATAPSTVPEPNTSAPTDATLEMDAGELKLEIVRLINIERANAGLPELQILPALMDCAQAKADDMAENRYFGHTSPVYGTAGEMIKSFVPESKSRGENIAPWRRTPEELIAGIYNSPPHLENMLNPRDTHIGIGLTMVGGGGFVCVQQYVRL